jgi:hypothetical protein
MGRKGVVFGWDTQVGRILWTTPLALQSLEGPIGNMTKPGSNGALTSSGGDEGMGIEATGTVTVPPRKSSERHAA